TRLYVVESTPTITGANADHRFGVKSTDMIALTRPDPRPFEWWSTIWRDLKQHSGASIVIVGADQAPSVHSLGHSMNDMLGNIGKTVFYSDPLEANSVDQTQSLRELV